jgi:hypothetical protein
MTIRITLTSASGDISADVDVEAGTAREETRLVETCARAEIAAEQTGDGTLRWDEHPTDAPEAEDHRGLITVEAAISLVRLWMGEGE